MLNSKTGVTEIINGVTEIINGVTFEEMCKTIVKADILKKKDGTKPTWEEVWNYSPTGELFMLAIWYDEALLKLGYGERLVKDGIEAANKWAKEFLEERIKRFKGTKDDEAKTEVTINNQKGQGDRSGVDIGGK